MSHKTFRRLAGLAGSALMVVSIRPVTLAAAQDRFFQSDGVQIRYVEAGAGEPIVLVHGFPTDLDHEWTESGVMTDLARDHHVIALDLRGHGKSGKPHDSSAYGVQLALDIDRLLTHLHIPRAHIVGYSLGAQATAKLLTMHPERFLTATLGGAVGRRNWTPQTELSNESAAKELEGGLAYGSLILATWPVDQPPPSAEVVRRASADLLARNDPHAHAAMVRARRGEVVTDADMAAVQVPTLAVVGTADAAFAGVKRLQQAWPALKVVAIEGATHSGSRSAVRHPAFVAAIREFVAANGVPSLVRVP